MNEQQVREIAEAAFRGRFPDVKLHRVNVWPGADFEDDSPAVDVNIIYDGKYEQLNARGLSRVCPPAHPVCLVCERSMAVLAVLSGRAGYGALRSPVCSQCLRSVCEIVHRQGRPNMSRTIGA